MKYWIVTQADGVWFRYYDSPPLKSLEAAKKEAGMYKDKFPKRKWDIINGTYEELAQWLHDQNKMFKGK